MADNDGSRTGGDGRGPRGGRGGQGGGSRRSGGRPGGRGARGRWDGADRRGDGRRRDDRRRDGDRDDRRYRGRGRDGERSDRDLRGGRRGGPGQGGRGRADQGGRGRGHGGERRHSNRRGRFAEDKRAPRTGPERPGFREERLNQRANEPALPDDVKANELDPSVLQDLRSLAKDNADTVARHMVMAAALMAEDPKLALRHARAAKERAGRVGVVRETAGVAAYHAGEWKEALSELRAARRISGGPGLVAVMADCERGLGRPEKAIELAHSEEAAQLDDVSRTELAIVVSGARRDMGDVDAAVMELEALNLDPSREDDEAVRLFYAYADVLLAAGRKDEAVEWFGRSAALDPDGVLDSADRIADIRGE
ncbi:tetratricopeptide repeat protein [Corynebacterium sp.]|uniref:tetratricopeptide repeat protein n=1 Tax=Corynebacterium sp. TaxID=1720 RepID=UPI0026DC7EC9|nr:tetratricopeptide repeat protein [Corynebacterium sp.]MDO4609265.1 tetratricopeptide repeat protein [Corynebacterium sp.]